MPIDFGYAQARAQARQGDRLSPSRWRAIEASTDLSRYIHGLRGTALSRVVRQFTGTASPHAIERALRVSWRSEVERASHWVPRAWRDSVAWTAWLPDLDAIGFLLDGNAALPWMHADPLLNLFALEDADDRRSAFEAVVGRLPPNEEFDPARWWYEQWRERLPAADLPGTGLDELIRYLRGFGAARRESASPSSAADESREALERRITRLLHRRPGLPVSVYCHLARTALELLRLRGGLVRRALANAGLAGERA